MALGTNQNTQNQQQFAQNQSQYQNDWQEALRRQESQRQQQMDQTYQQQQQYQNQMNQWQQPQWNPFGMTTDMGMGQGPRNPSNPYNVKFDASGKAYAEDRVGDPQRDAWINQYNAARNQPWFDAANYGPQAQGGGYGMTTGMGMGQGAPGGMNTQAWAPNEWNPNGGGQTPGGNNPPPSGPPGYTPPPSGTPFNPGTNPYQIPGSGNGFLGERSPWREWYGQDWFHPEAFADKNSPLARMFENLLPFMQFTQNNWQYGNDFQEGRRRWDADFNRQYGNDMFSQWLAGENLGLNRWNMGDTSKLNWAQQAQSEKRDEREYGLAQEKAKLDQWVASENSRLREREADIDNQYKNGLITNQQRELALKEIEQNRQFNQLQLEQGRRYELDTRAQIDKEKFQREQLENQLTQARYGAFGRAQAPNARFIRSWG